jgi:hypothetical protein
VTVPRSPQPAGDVPAAGGTSRGDLQSVLVEEATKKSALLWLTIGAAPARAAWHVWVDGAAYVVSGGGEQPLPGIDTAEQALVTVRSKDKGVRLVSWVAHVQQVEPGTEAWEAAARELQSKRLNAPDGEAAPQRWARESRITRLQPTGEVLERPGAMPTQSGAAPPRPTPATTRGPLPFVIGKGTRRKRR